MSQDIVYHAMRMSDEQPCSVCGRTTNLAEVYVLAGLRIPLCSRESYDAHWSAINMACNGWDDGCEDE